MADFTSDLPLGMIPDVEPSTLFETERLFARRLTAADAPQMLAIFGDAETMRYVGDGEILTEENCVYWVDDVTDKNFELRGYGLIGMFEKATSELVGCSGVFHPDRQPEPEVMYYLRRDRWRMGFATEIVHGLVAHARSHWGIGWIMATVHPDNLPSQRVLVKAGFKRTKDRMNEDGSITQVWELPQPA